MTYSWRLNLSTISILTRVERRNCVNQQLSIMLHNYWAAKWKLFHHAATGGCHSLPWCTERAHISFLSWYLDDLFMMVSFFPSIFRPTYCGTWPDMYRMENWMAVIGVVILCEQECQDTSKPMSVKDCVWIFFRVCVWQYSCMLLALSAVLG